jgi:hypothetical protein
MFWGIMRFGFLKQGRGHARYVLREVASSKRYEMGILGYSQLRVKYPAVEKDGLMGQWTVEENLLKLVKEEKDIREFMKKAKSIENPLKPFYE